MPRPHSRAGITLALRRALRPRPVRAAAGRPRAALTQFALALAFLLTAALAAVLVTEAWMSWRHPELETLRAELDRAKERLRALEPEVTRLRAGAQSGGRTLTIERAAQEQLSKQLKLLADENARLKEEIAVFESLSTSSTSRVEALVSAFHVQAGAEPGHYRYRLIAAVRGGRSAGERVFRGQYQLSVRFSRGGQLASLPVPAPNEAGREKYALRFRQFQRVDGTFQIPPDARLLAVEARLQSEGITRASRVFDTGPG